MVALFAGDVMEIECGGSEARAAAADIAIMNPAKATSRPRRTRIVIEGYLRLWGGSAAWPTKERFLLHRVSC